MDPGSYHLVAKVPSPIAGKCCEGGLKYSAEGGTHVQHIVKTDVKS
jgi:hypothetical protein